MPVPGRQGEHRGVPHHGIERCGKKIGDGEHRRARARTHRRLTEKSEHFRRALRGKARGADVVRAPAHYDASAETALVALVRPLGQTELQRGKIVFTNKHFICHIPPLNKCFCVLRGYSHASHPTRQRSATRDKDGKNGRCATGPHHPARHSRLSYKRMRACKTQTRRYAVRGRSPRRTSSPPRRRGRGLSCPAQSRAARGTPPPCPGPCAP